MNEYKQSCYLCGVDSTYTHVKDIDAYAFDCKNCGKYTISHDVLNRQESFEKIRHKILSFLMEKDPVDENRYIIVTKKAYDECVKNENLNGIVVSIDQILEDFPKTTKEKIERTIKTLCRVAGDISKTIHLENHDYPIFFIENENGVASSLDILEHEGYVLNPQRAYGTGFSLTPQAWAIYEETVRLNNSKEVFVAMWFDEDMNRYYHDGIEEAIKDCQLEPIRMDKVPHNEKICEMIYKKIDDARFVIADMTGCRGNVLFECGYAIGSKKTVIWIIEEEYEKNNPMPFDIRQYSHIIYKDSQDLRKKLADHIKNTIK